MRITPVDKCLNPPFGGIYSDRLRLENLTDTLLCLNPPFGGIYSDVYKVRSSRSEPCLNPPFGGIYSDPYPPLPGTRAVCVLTRLSAASIPTQFTCVGSIEPSCLNPPFGGIYSDMGYLDPKPGHPCLNPPFGGIYSDHRSYSRRLQGDVLTRLSAASIPTVNPYSKAIAEYRLNPPFGGIYSDG